jgi:hypothetical protein
VLHVLDRGEEHFFNSNKGNSHAADGDFDLQTAATSLRLTRMQRFRTAYSPKDQKESSKDYDLGLKTILDKKPVASVVDVEMHQDDLRGTLSSRSLRV